MFLLYDLFSVITEQKSKSFFVLNILDGIFVTTVIAIMIFVLFNVSNGYVRAYEFVGAIIGACLYKIALSRLVKCLFTKITEGIFAIFDFFCKLLLTPIKFMYKIMYDIMHKLTICVFNTLRRVLRYKT